jgi:hypothetical protein
MAKLGLPISGASTTSRLERSRLQLWKKANLIHMRRSARLAHIYQGVVSFGGSDMVRSNDRQLSQQTFDYLIFILCSRQTFYAEIEVQHPYFTSEGCVDLHWQKRIDMDECRLYFR